MLDAQPGLSNMKAPKKPAAVVGGPLAPLTLPNKAESVVSITSQCSYSSTIVHVGDKKPQPESGTFVFLILFEKQNTQTEKYTWNDISVCVCHAFVRFCLTMFMALLLSTEIIEDVAESPAPPALPVSVVSPTSQEKEAYKKLGLTKQVLAAHTQKEEQAFLNRCRELRNARTLQKNCSPYLHKRSPANAEGI